MTKEFDDFKRYFKEYQYRFGLTGYKVYFKYEPLEGSFSDMAIAPNIMVATATLNSELPDKEKPFRDIKRDAKHETIHLLLGRLSHLAESRYTTGEELYEAMEEVVYKLEELIGD